MRVYLDHLSSCPLAPEARDAMLPFLGEKFGHPGSLHQEGLLAREAIKSAREQIAQFINAEAGENILFTGSSTEAINLAIKGSAFAQRGGKHIVLSTAEQPGVNASVEWLSNYGFTSTKVPVDGEGRISLEALKASIRDDTILVCVHHANLDIGTIQRMNDISEITRPRGVALFVDATASAGWIPVNVQALKADLLALAPHRFYGPKGIGILYRHRRARISPIVHGLDLDVAENVAGIVGAGKAAALASSLFAERGEGQDYGDFVLNSGNPSPLPSKGREPGVWTFCDPLPSEGRGQGEGSSLRSLQERFLSELYHAVPHVRLNGPPPGPERLPNNLNISIEFIEGEGLALMVDVKGLALASGAACVTKTMRVPPVLAAIGLPESLARGNVIVSFGHENTEAEVQFAVATIAKAVDVLREMSPLWEDFKNGLIRSEIGK